jgi:hypothetical protein
VKGLVALAIVNVIAGCSGAVERSELGSLSFEAPTAWTRTDSRGNGSLTAVFAPSDNLRKETVTIIRTEVGPIAKEYSSGTLSQLLAGAQSALTNGHTSPISRVTTESGLAGMQVVVDFFPSGLSTPYHRVHAVLSDGTALIHILYTALTPDPELGAFHRVLSTLREES